VAGDGKQNPVPARSENQRLDALHKANEIRSRRSQLKKDLAARNVQILDILTSPPDFAHSERIAVLLLALPGYGPARVSKLLHKTRISESKRIGGLSERQRAELIQHFQR